MPSWFIHLVVPASPGWVKGLPQEALLLRQVSVRLIAETERARFDELLAQEHYLKNATVLGQALRYVAEAQGQWLALVVFSSAALYLKPRDRWLHWSARRVAPVITSSRRTSASWCWPRRAGGPIWPRGC